ncbi:hypothetical protein [Sporosarcina sp. 6E9]|uniref:hypothetical protein n=1 Tax=Sporosarcina sp. 6E9 TaxID=2819235 RepID=UPI001AD395E4|nr:hypothetical protein [Sporosarcina sp. 6E9]MBO1910124.1 hypothetical protein [Microvirga sp. 3-52]
MANKFEDLKRLYLNLLEILEKYGRGEIDIQIRQVKQILDFLINLPSVEIEEKYISEVRKMHESLFPPRGGLSDFFIWSNDYDERIRLNEPLENVRKEIYDILNH